MEEEVVNKKAEEDKKKKRTSLTVSYTHLTLPTIA